MELFLQIFYCNASELDGCRNSYTVLEARSQRGHLDHNLWVRSSNR